MPPLCRKYEIWRRTVRSLVLTGVLARRKDTARGEEDEELRLGDMGRVK